MEPRSRMRLMVIFTICAALANLLGSLVFEGCGLHNGNHSGFSLFRLIASLHTDGINVVICHSYYSFRSFFLLYISKSWAVKGRKSGTLHFTLKNILYLHNINSSALQNIFYLSQFTYYFIFVDLTK